MSKLPATFSVTTGREGGGGEHFYFIVSTSLDKTHKLRDPADPDQQHDIGHIKWTGGQAVGPGSIHPSGRIYTVKNDIEIATVKGEEILTAMRVWLQHEIDDEVHSEERREAVAEKIPLEELKIEHVIDVKTLKATSTGYQGEHPVHGSSTGANFTVNTLKGVWHCFRCQSGGGPLALIAVKEGLIPCDQVLPGVIRGDLFKKTVAVAAEKYGLKMPEKRRRKRQPREEDPYEFPHIMAAEIMSKHHFKTARDTEELYIYNDGIYHDDGEVRVKTWAVEIDPEKTSHYAQEVIFQIKAKTYTPREVFNSQFNLIPVENGILDISTYTLKDFTPDFVFTMTVPVKYDPAADCPLFKKFLKEVLNADDLDVIQELMGYCLLRDYRYQKAFMFVGDGANGKSTLIEAMRRFLGKDNVSSIPLQELTEDRFSSSQLYGRLANMFADLPAKALYQTGKFKTLTGGDTINAQKKFQDGFAFLNYAKLIFSCNKFPQVKGDGSSAYYRRWQVITFPHAFPDNDPNTDKDLINKITAPAELSGILNWALEGLKRLRANNSFSRSKTADETREAVDRLSDPLTAFTMDCIRVTNSDADAISKEEFYSKYVEYCDKNKLPKVTKTQVGHDLPSILSGVRSKENVTIKGTRQRAWVCIRWATDSEREGDDAPAPEQQTKRTIEEFKPHDEDDDMSGGHSYFDGG